MDRFASTKKIIDSHWFRCLKGLFRALFLGFALLPAMNSGVFGGSSTPGLMEHPSPETCAADHETITMEAMNIKGKVDKPTIMYVIPRAHIEIEMKLNDTYFSTIDPDEMISVLGEEETRTPEKSFQSLLTESFSVGNAQYAKNGLCISCHYPRMPIPQDSRSQSLFMKLNQICLQCHPLHYYHIGWKEVEQTIFCSRDEDSSKTVCQNCHPAWIQQTEKDKTGTMRHNQEYNANELCKIYHKFRATRPGRKSR